jgi:molybdenum cofactor guanylyltransferase
MTYSAVILAGGKSTRMGRDKAWLPLDGQPLLARQIAVVRELDPLELFFSGRADVDYGALGCRLLTDRFPDAGPLAGIEVALDAASAPRLLVLAVDMPHMSADVLRQLVRQCTETKGVIPRLAGEIEPLAAVYPKSAWPLVTELLSKPAATSPSARAFAERCVTAGLARFVDFPASSARCFANWNVPTDAASPD